jgi:hypothetical protein
MLLHCQNLQQEALLLLLLLLLEMLLLLLYDKGCCWAPESFPACCQSRSHPHLLRRLLLHLLLLPPFLVPAGAAPVQSLAALLALSVS